MEEANLAPIWAILQQEAIQSLIATIAKTVNVPLKEVMDIFYKRQDPSEDTARKIAALFGYSSEKWDMIVAMHKAAREDSK